MGRPKELQTPSWMKVTTQSRAITHAHKHAHTHARMHTRTYPTADIGKKHSAPWRPFHYYTSPAGTHTHTQTHTHMHACIPTRTYPLPKRSPHTKHSPFSPLRHPPTHTHKHTHTFVCVQIPLQGLPPQFLFFWLHLFCAGVKSPDLRNSFHTIGRLNKLRVNFCHDLKLQR